MSSTLSGLDVRRARRAVDRALQRRWVQAALFTLTLALAWLLASGVAHSLSEAGA